MDSAHIVVLVKWIKSDNCFKIRLSQIIYTHQSESSMVLKELESNESRDNSALHAPSGRSMLPLCRLDRDINRLLSTSAPVRLSSHDSVLRSSDGTHVVVFFLCRDWCLWTKIQWIEVFVWGEGIFWCPIRTLEKQQMIRWFSGKRAPSVPA